MRHRARAAGAPRESRPPPTGTRDRRGWCRARLLAPRLARAPDHAQRGPATVTTTGSRSRPLAVAAGLQGRRWAACCTTRCRAEPNSNWPGAARSGSNNRHGRCARPDERELSLLALASIHARRVPDPVQVKTARPQAVRSGTSRHREIPVRREALHPGAALKRHGGKRHGGRASVLAWTACCGSR